QQTRKTRAVRRHLRQLHDQLPGPARALFDTLGDAFHRATALRFGLLLAAALLTVGRHTVANLLRTLGPLVPGDPSSYRRVFSQRRWSSSRLARLLAGCCAGSPGDSSSAPPTATSPPMTWPDWRPAIPSG